MAIDYAEKEREFLESLAEDTGRDLAGWMAAISATALTDRNAIIDWLRQQGFLFAKASWMERIHHNGGRPIYLDPSDFGLGASARAKPAPSPVPAPAVAPVVASVQVAAPTFSASEPALIAIQKPVAAVAPAGVSASLETLIAEAKAYRPLAQFVLREIEKAAPDLVFEARKGYVALCREGALAGVLVIGPKELRLAVPLGERVLPAPFTKAKFAKSHPDLPAEISHMVILTDARQVTPELVAIFAQSASAASVRSLPE